MNGSAVEYINVPAAFVYKIPDKTDPVVAAALLNKITGSWMALKYRVDFLRPSPAADVKKDWSCLVNGVTTKSGTVAVGIARMLGATKVYGTGRDESTLSKVEGLDGYVVLNEASVESVNFGEVASAVDVVLDFIGGPWPRQFLLNSTMKNNVKSPLTFVSIGIMAGGDALDIPPSVLRLRDVTIRGSGMGSWTARHLCAEFPQMLHHLEGTSQEKANVKLFDLDDAGAKAGFAWNGKENVVFRLEHDKGI